MTKPVFDRTPPQNVEAERSLLGCILLNAADSWPVVAETLELGTRSFYAESHQRIYAAMLGCVERGIAIDTVTVYQQLADDGNVEAIGGVTYLSGLTGTVPTSANVEYYARIVAGMALRREILARTALLQAVCYSGADDARESLSRLLGDFRTSERTNSQHAIADSLREYTAHCEMLIDAPEDAGIGTGLPALTAMLRGGLQSGEFMLIAGRPSQGKTAFAVHLAYHAATRHAAHVLVFSLEMAHVQLAARIAAMHNGYCEYALRQQWRNTGELERLRTATRDAATWTLTIDDRAGASQAYIESAARRWVRDHGPRCAVVVDYLQLMRVKPGRSREQEVSEISRGMKALARELSIPVVVLSQLNRSVEESPQKSGWLGKLRESGSLEQDADTVVFVGSKRASDMKCEEWDICVAKQRNGRTGNVDAHFNRNRQTFSEVEQHAEQPAQSEDAPWEDD